MIEPYGGQEKEICRIVCTSKNNINQSLLIKRHSISNIELSDKFVALQFASLKFLGECNPGAVGDASLRASGGVEVVGGASRYPGMSIALNSATPDFFILLLIRCGLVICPFDVVDSEQYANNF